MNKIVHTIFFNSSNKNYISQANFTKFTKKANFQKTFSVVLVSKIVSTHLQIRNTHHCEHCFDLTKEHIFIGEFKYT